MSTAAETVCGDVDACSRCMFFTDAAEAGEMCGSGAGSSAGGVAPVGVAGDVDLLKDEGVPGAAVSSLLMTGILNSSPLS